ncbi:WD40 repeat domain-containing protein [Crateriforma spongiae]|uniref:WD40 repeat domain-containing protein n=1 Tax=Crateriforma spongiae TaxID=2724528 RepID=UPI001446F8AA|nr:WD40 repeat domain-containing protein [Crateriforma spongiae]
MPSNPSRASGPADVSRLPRIVSRRSALRRMLAAALIASPVDWTQPSSAAPPDATQLTVNMRVPHDGQVLRLRHVTKDDQSVVITAIASDPAGRLIAAAGDDLAIRLIDAETMEVVRTVTDDATHHHRDVIRTLAFDDSGHRLVSSGNDGCIVIRHSAADFAATQHIDGAPALTCVRFHPSGRQMAAVGFDEEVFLIGKPAAQTKLRCGCRDLRSIAFSPDGKVMAVGGRVGDVHLFSTDPVKANGDHSLHRGRIRSMAFRRGSDSMVSVGEDGDVVVFDVNNRKIARRVHVGNCRLFCVTMLDSRIAAAGGSDNRIHLIDTDAGQLIGHLAGHRGTISDVAQAGQWLYSGSYDATIRRWDLHSLQESVPQLAGREDRIVERPNRLDR